MPNRRVTRRVTRSKHASIIECHRLRRQNMTEEQKKAESAARLNRKHRQKQREREAALAQKEYAENKLKRLARKRELGRIRAARYRERLKDKKFKNVRAPTTINDKTRFCNLIETATSPITTELLSINIGKTGCSIIKSSLLSMKEKLCVN